MTSEQILETIEKLRAMGATSVSVTADGGVSATFSAPKQAVTGPAALATPVPKQRRPDKTQDQLPPEAARAAWREKVLEMADGT